jgi:hypothetical protein
MSTTSIRSIAIAVALAALVATAGCSAGSVPGLGDGGGSVSVDSVPADADVVMSVDVQGMLSDSTNEELANGVMGIDDTASGAQNLGEALDDIENDTGLDPRKADRMIAFGQTESQDAGNNYGAALISGEWTEDEIVDAIEEDGDTTLEEDEYGGKTVYVQESEFGSDSWLGILGDGRYVVGTEDAVKDAIDVDTGEADALSGELRTAYDDTRDGYVRFAMTVPTDDIPTEAVGRQTNLNAEAFTSLNTVSGAYYTDGDTVGLSMSMASGSEDDATDVYDVTNGAVSLARGATDNDEIKSALQDVEVEQDGSTVTVTYSNTAEAIVDLFEALSEMGGPTGTTA